MMSTGRPDVAVIFVNYHSEPEIGARLAPLVAQGWPIVVADNSGTFDGAMGVEVVPTGGNVGFGSACNRAVATLAPDIDVVCFHNPDVDVSPVTIEELAIRLMSRPGTGALAPAELVGTSLYVSGYRYPTPAREVLLVVRNLRRLRRVAADSSVFAAPESHDGRSPRPKSSRGRRFPSAALLVARRAEFDVVGGFDERYFLYVEDLDLVHRLRTSGLKVEVESDLVACHHFARGSVMAASRRELLRWMGVELFAQVHGTTPWRLLRAVHRPFVRVVGGQWPIVGAEVERLWAARATPVEVIETVRPLLESGGSP